MSNLKAAKKVSRRRVGRIPTQHQAWWDQILDGLDDLVKGRNPKRAAQNINRKIVAVMVDPVVERELMKMIVKLSKNDQLKAIHELYKIHRGVEKGFLEFLKTTRSKYVHHIMEKTIGKGWKTRLKLPREVNLSKLPEVNSDMQQQFQELIKLYQDVFPKNWKSELWDNILQERHLAKYPLNFSKGVDLSTLPALSSGSGKKISKDLLTMVKGKLGELLANKKTLEHLKDLSKNDAFEHVRFYPNIIADYQDLDKVARKGQQLTDGMIIGKLADQDRYQILLIREVKTSELGVIDALKQVHRRSELAEDISKIRPQGHYFEFNDAGKLIGKEVSGDGFPYNRSPGKPGIFGYFDSRKTIFAHQDGVKIPSSEAISALGTTVPINQTDVFSLQLNHAEIESFTMSVILGMTN